jgi:hypothetical protein
MSTVLPPAAALVLVLPLLLLLLLLLLQPTAAKAIAAKAAIAVVRLMMFLSSFEVVRLPRSVPTGPVGLMAPRQPGGSRFDAVPYGDRTALGVDSGQDPRPGERRHRRLGRRFPLPSAQPTLTFDVATDPTERTSVDDRDYRR